MQLLIIGQNRTKIFKVKPADYNKHFVATDGMVYKTYPDGLTRCVRTEYGHKVNDEEIIVYAENAIVPYHPRKQCYAFNKILSEIDEHKMADPKPRQSVLRLLVTHSGEFRRAWAAYGTFIIVGVIVIYALVFS